jgi:DNA-binding LacI/PurR family transcriptional regulator
MFSDLCVDGLIVHTGYNPSAELLQRLTQAPVPLVFANAAGDQDCVRPDESDGVDRAYRALRGRGCRRIAWAAASGAASPLPPGMQGHHSRSDRTTAFAACLAADGAEPLPPLLLNSDVLAQPLQATSWLSQVEPDAVIAESAGEAEMLAHVARQAVRRQPCLLAFSVTTLRPLVQLGVGQIAIPLGRIAEWGFEMLEARIAQGGRSVPTRLVDYDDPKFPDATH